MTVALPPVDPALVEDSGVDSLGHHGFSVDGHSLVLQAAGPVVDHVVPGL